MAKDDDETPRPHRIPTTKPLHRADMARSWIEAAADVLAQTGFEDEAVRLHAMAKRIAEKIGPVE